MQLLFGEIGIVVQFNSHIVKAFERAHTRRTDCDCLTAMCDEFVDGLLVHTDIFGVHLVPLNLLAFHWFECSSTHMQCQFLTVDAVSVDVGEHLVGEM